MTSYDLSDPIYVDKLPYDCTSPEAILKFAIPLAGKTLRDFMTPEQLETVRENKTNKGDLGNLVEKYYFLINPGNSPKPDFPVAKVELKTTAVKPGSRNRRKKTYALPIDATKYQAKERLKLASINYHKLDKEIWNANSLFEKCGTMLLLVSLYDSKISVIDRRFVAVPFLWKLPEKDIAIIQRDWETIVNKIHEGKAHEISGADTLYLEATTSGSGTLKSQPNSTIDAKERSFAFKAAYVTNAMLSGAKFVDSLEPILQKDDSPYDLEKILIERVKPYYDHSVDELIDGIGQGIGESKQKLALLSNRLLGIKSRRAEELVKAGIEVKSVNLRPNGTPSQDVSFPAFSYMDIVDEDWEDSTFKMKIDSKMLFMIYQTDKAGTCAFKKAMFWSMPETDIVEAHRVWQETKQRVINGMADKLPLKKFSDVAHVRNHGATSRPEHQIPSPHNGLLPVKGFWLNQKYVKRQLATL